MHRNDASRSYSPFPPQGLSRKFLKFLCAKRMQNYLPPPRRQELRDKVRVHHKLVLVTFCYCDFKLCRFHNIVCFSSAAKCCESGIVFIPGPVAQSFRIRKQHKKWPGKQFFLLYRTKKSCGNT